MKNRVKLLSVLCICLLVSCSSNDDEPINDDSKVGFVTTWETTITNEKITIPINTSTVFTYDYTVDWVMELQIQI